MKKIIFTTIAIAATVIFYGCGDDNKEEEQTTGNIYGVITDKATGEPISAAGIELHLCLGEEERVIPPYKVKTWSLITSTVTGSEGQYDFSNLNVGEYRITVKKTGYISDMRENIYVEAGKIAKGDWQIEKQPAILRILDDNRTEISSLSFGSSLSEVSKSFNIFNDSPASLHWEIVKSAPWISSTSKTNGTLNAGSTQGIIVVIDKNQLAEGQNATTIHILTNNGNKAITITAIK